MNPYTILGAVAIVAMAAFGGAAVGRKMERSTWQAKEIAIASAAQKELMDAVASNQRAVLFNQAKERKATADHEQALNELTQKYDASIAANRAAGGLRITRAVCGDSTTATAKAPGASGLDVAPSGVVALPEATQRDLYTLTKRADELAEQLRGLESWIVSNGFYGEEATK